MKHATVLVVDDEPRILRLVKSNLEPDGYRVYTAPDGETALRYTEMYDPDLIILDIMLPGIDGFEVCRRIREFSTVPIIMLTAKGEEHDKVRGLDVGADDYLSKPFGVNELRARVRAVLRRARLPADAKKEPVFTCGDLTVNFLQRRVTLRGQPVRLSPTEYKLLYELVSNAGRVMLHQDLLRRVWGRGYGEETEYLRVYVRYLRQKIEDDPSRPRYILTEPGVGYRFADPATFGQETTTTPSNAGSPGTSTTSSPTTDN